MIQAAGELASSMGTRIKAELLHTRCREDPRYLSQGILIGDSRTVLLLWRSTIYDQTPPGLQLSSWGGRCSIAVAWREASLCSR